MDNFTERIIRKKKREKHVLGLLRGPSWNNVGIFDEKMYFKGEDYYGRSCSDNSDPGFGYHGNAGNSHGLDRAV